MVGKEKNVEVLNEFIAVIHEPGHRKNRLQRKEGRCESSTLANLSLGHQSVSGVVTFDIENETCYRRAYLEP